MANTTLSIIIRNKQEILFEGKATALTSLNQKGPFDILPEHAHFIGLINEFLIVYELDKPPQKFKIDEGLIQVEDDVVKIFLQTEMKPIAL